jgi:hypothetical protein
MIEGVLEMWKKNYVWVLFLLVAGIFLALAGGVHASEAPKIKWQKSLGTPDNDGAHSIQQTTDGGYIVAGHSYSAALGDCWIVRLDSVGKIVWHKSLRDYKDSQVKSIRQTRDGGYILAGEAISENGFEPGYSGNSNYDYWIVRLDARGNLLWQKLLGGLGDDYATSIGQTADGGYIVAGFSSSSDGDVSGNHGDSDCWVVRLGAKGNIVWRKSLGGSSDERAYSVQQTTDGGYIVAGVSYSVDGDVSGNHGDSDCWVVRLDAKGKLIWQKSLGGSRSDYATSIGQTADGGYIVAGASDSKDGDVSGNHGASDYWVVKLDVKGRLVWQKSLGGSLSDSADAVQQTTDGGYIVAGISDSKDGDVFSNHGSNDYWIVKLDAGGNLVWQKSLGGSREDFARSIQQTADGGYIVAGESESNNGDVSGNHGGSDYWIVKLMPGEAISPRKKR